VDTIDKIKRIMELNRVMMNQTTLLHDAIAAGNTEMIAHYSDAQNIMATVIGNITVEPVDTVIDRYNKAVQEIKDKI
jgi:hypothetical protein